ncbi:threonine--tRNA ligase 1, cytoplasmic-like [Pleurodeles waltl]|uniref:threonine--tRNA ligase 1, cytoplasmic-like n=1 Tax=Pleurodeles waltl TaxID=8319 RepID=UPI003709830D
MHFSVLVRRALWVQEPLCRCISNRTKPLPAYIEHRLNTFERLREQHQVQLLGRLQESRAIRISLPDRTEVDGRSWETTPYQVALQASRSLAESAVAARVNGTLHDLDRPLEEDSEVEFLTFDSSDGQAIFWHSSAHILGAALEHLYDGLLCHGPNIDNGFFYDMFLNHGTILGTDLPALEMQCKSLVKEKLPFERISVTRDDLKELFQYNKFKMRIIEEKVKTASTTVYRCGSLVDLCQGPHVCHTGQIKAFKLVKNSASFWNGDSSQESLQRVYGISFPDGKQLKEWERMQEEASKRDHRKIGRDQELFFFHAVSPGSCFFLPRGAQIYNTLMKFIKSEYRQRGFQEVITPNIFNSKLWETSGHWEHYSKNMFSFQVEDEMFALKPMNCPGHCLMFDHRPRSWRELPLRLADFGVLHRNEVSGALSGLTRVRRFQQDDAHIFCAMEQLEAEIAGCLEFLRAVYSVFGFTFKLFLSTRPEEFLGQVETWDQAEKTGFKPCEAGHRMMSVTDPHRVCLWCLEYDHDPKSCSKGRATHPKVLRERSLKFVAARRSTLHRSWSPSKGRSRDRLRGHHHSSSLKSSGHSGKKKKAARHSSTSPHRSADATREECRCSRLLFAESTSGSALRLPEFPGAGATPAVLKEFYEAMHLIFGQSDPSAMLSGPGGLEGSPSGSVPAASALAQRVPPDPLWDLCQCQSYHCPAPARSSTLPTMVVPTIDVDPILIPDDPEPERRQPTPLMTSMGPSHPRLDSDPHYAGYEYEEGLEETLDPLEYQLDNPDLDWAQELGEASGLDTFADAGMLSPPTVATAEGDSYSMVVSRAAEVLGLELPTAASGRISCRSCFNMGLPLRSLSSHSMKPSLMSFWIDIQIKDAIGRYHQCATIQLDFQLPIRFNLSYVSKDGSTSERPVMIHRAILGSVERMVAILAENYGGKWPLWLSPFQVMVIPVGPSVEDYAKEVHRGVREGGFAVDIDTDSGTTLNRKIRKAQLAQYNFVLVVGEKEKANSSVNVRTRDQVQHGEHPIQSFLTRLRELQDLRVMNAEELF